MSHFKESSFSGSSIHSRLKAPNLNVYNKFSLHAIPNRGTASTLMHSQPASTPPQALPPIPCAAGFGPKCRPRALCLTQQGAQGPTIPARACGTWLWQFVPLGWQRRGNPSWPARFLLTRAQQHCLVFQPLVSPRQNQGSVAAHSSRIGRDSAHDGNLQHLIQQRMGFQLPFSLANTTTLHAPGLEGNEVLREGIH